MKPALLNFLRTVLAASLGLVAPAVALGAVTNAPIQAVAVRIPLEAEPSGSVRTNVASGLVNALNLYSTNRILLDRLGGPVLTNAVGDAYVQVSVSQGVLSLGWTNAGGFLSMGDLSSVSVSTFPNDAGYVADLSGAHVAYADEAWHAASAAYAEHAGAYIESDPVAMSQGFITFGGGTENDLIVVSGGGLGTADGSTYIMNIVSRQGFLTGESDPVAMSQGFISSESDPVAMSQGFITGESDPVALSQGFVASGDVGSIAISAVWSADNTAMTAAASGIGNILSSGFWAGKWISSDSFNINGLSVNDGVLYGNQTVGVVDWAGNKLTDFGGALALVWGDGINNSVPGRLLIGQDGSTNLNWHTRELMGVWTGTVTRAEAILPGISQTFSLTNAFAGATQVVVYADGVVTNRFKLP